MPSLLDAQGRGGCELELKTTPGSISRLVRSEGDSYYEVGGGIEATCGTMWVRADSAKYYETRGELYLYRNVRYRDETRTLESERATYYQREDRVRAEGKVVLTDEASGSTLRGPLLDYYPQSERRPLERIFAPQRPHLTFYPDSSGRGAGQPFDVDGDRVNIYGNSLIATAGNVVALRGNLSAFGDSLHLDLNRNELWLVGQPRILASETTLEGDTILVLLEQNEVREILAWPNGSAIGNQLQLSAPTLHFYIDGEEIDRGIAWLGGSESDPAAEVAGGEPWARSVSGDHVLVADSIEIQRPGGRLERIVAVGRARAATLQPVVPGDELLGHDWLEGDTVVGHFAPGDSASPVAAEPELTRLVASGNARALYHIRQEDDRPGPAGQLAVNYVIGKVVTMWLEDGEVRQANVIGPSTGLYLEPLPLAIDGDSLQVAPDSSRTAPDTMPRASRARRGSRR